MMAKIIIGYPPNIKEIRKVFPIEGNEIFSWDGIIYNPGNITITPELLAHEEVHFKQQLRDPESWWVCYLEDPQFRLEQEVEAHHVEYTTYKARHKNRNHVGAYLNSIARRLCSPLYGGLLTHGKAIGAIRRGSL